MNPAPYLEGLNEMQREAVLYTQGPVMVLAGAGSGKTRVITHRIVHLIHQGIHPKNILAVTFTNKAAKEMRERVVDLVRKFPPSDRATIDAYPTTTTFHSLGVKIIRENHSTLNLPKHFKIYDRSDSNKAIKEAMVLAGYGPKQFEPRKILGAISRAKGDAISQSSYQENAEKYFAQVVAKVWHHYEELLRQDGALDFDDLLLKTLRLIESHPYIKELLTDRYRYIMVDEYQDTNKVQYEIVRHLAGTERNLCVVGDIDQNIYSWRGADIKNVLQFEKHFSGAKVILLEENYRSTKNIIEASNNIIKKNRQRVDKTVFTNNDQGEKIVLKACYSGNEEAEYVALTTGKIIDEGNRPSDIAVLFRTNFQSRILEEAFLNFKIPYQLLGVKFFERKEIKDVLSYLRLALNESSRGDLSRIINEPSRVIGKVTLLKILEGRQDELTGSTQNKVEQFFQIISDIKDKINTDKLSEVLKFIIKRSGIEANYRQSGTAEDLERLENLQELVTLSLRYDELDGEDAVSLLIEEAALQSDQDELQSKEDKDAVRLMTVHSAKGLEFPFVFIVGLEEGLFPHQRLDEEIIDQEEERRLFYVALTRASKKVFLSYANTRTIYGSQRVNLPSSFLNDIPKELVEMDSDSDYNSGFERIIEID